MTTEVAIGEIRKALAMARAERDGASVRVSALEGALKALGVAMPGGKRGRRTNTDRDDAYVAEIQKDGSALTLRRRLGASHGAYRYTVRTLLAKGRIRCVGKRQNAVYEVIK